MNLLLRLFTCSVWIAALFMMFIFGLRFFTSEFGSPEQMFWARRVIACGAINIVGILVHSHLIREEKQAQHE